MADQPRRSGRARVNVDVGTRRKRGMRPPGAPAPATPATTPAVERVTTSNGSATLDPNVSASIVSAQDSDRVAVTINLPDGTADGFQKCVVFRAAEALEVDFYRLSATFDEVPVGGSLKFPSAGGGAVLVWDAAGGFWMPAGVYLSST